jgi:hypothetical protein
LEFEVLGLRFGVLGLRVWVLGYDFRVYDIQGTGFRV